MTEGKKALEFKHAHITGQAMRDHWGPIVERIAAETADWRDAWIYDLITENERLREALIDVLVYAPDYMHGMPKKHYEKIARGEQ